MGEGRRIYAQDVPGKKPSSSGGSEGSSHFYRLRPAAASDARFLWDLNRRGRGRYPLTSAGDEGLWRYEVAGLNPEGEESLGVWIVEDAAGKSAGYGCHLRDFRGGTMQVEAYELANGASWLEVTPFVLRELAEIGHKRVSSEEESVSLRFVLGEHHPLCEVIP